MNGKDFGEVVNLIVKHDPRFDKGAYFFVREALDHTVKKASEDDSHNDGGHVTGQQLLEGIREYSLEQYGPMTKTLFEEWGIQSGRDFGAIVFNLVEYEVFGKTENDGIDDFDEGYDFQEAFVKPFLPRRKTKRPGKGSAGSSVASSRSTSS